MHCRCSSINAEDQCQKIADFFFIGKQIALKKRNGALKHTWSTQKGHQNKGKTKNKGRTPEKPKRQHKSYIKPPTSCL
jgi:hypothetical protein